jgi:hypothetical protein
MTSMTRMATEIPASILTPDRVETRIGTLDFVDGMPSAETLAKVYDHLDFVHAFEAFVGSLPWVNSHALRRGLLDAGVKDDEFIVYPLLDAKSLIMTANADTPSPPATWT